MDNDLSDPPFEQQGLDIQCTKLFSHVHGKSPIGAVAFLSFLNNVLTIQTNNIKMAPYSYCLVF